MTKQTVNATTVTPDQDVEFLHHSDGSELVPSEIHQDIQDKDDLVAGYTKDDEGIVNNFALEPDMSEATYPTPKQQSRYVFLGAGAIVFVIALLILAFTVS